MSRVEVLLVAGSLGGIVLGWGLSQLGELWRSQREDRTRFSAARREAYARFLVDAAAVIDELRSAAYAAQHEPRPAVGTVDVGRVDRILAPQRRLRQSAIEVGLLAGDQEIGRAAADLRDGAGYAIGLVADQHDPYATNGAWARFEARWKAAVAKFETAARADLRIA